MTTSADRQIDLSQYINIKQDVKAVLGFTNVFLYTKPGKKVEVYEQLKKASEKSTTFRVYDNIIFCLCSFYISLSLVLTTRLSASKGRIAYVEKHTERNMKLPSGIQARHSQSCITSL